MCRCLPRAATNHNRQWSATLRAEIREITDHLLSSTNAFKCFYSLLDDRSFAKRKMYPYDRFYEHLVYFMSPLFSLFRLDENFRHGLGFNIPGIINWVRLFMHDGANINQFYSN